MVYLPQKNFLTRYFSPSKEIYSIAQKSICHSYLFLRSFKQFAPADGLSTELQQRSYEEP